MMFYMVNIFMNCSVMLPILIVIFFLKLLNIPYWGFSTKLWHFHSEKITYRYLYFNSWKTFKISVAHFSQEKSWTLFRPNSIFFFLSFSSFSISSIFSAISPTEYGSKYVPASPATSGKEETLETMTGVPEAMASETG